MPAFRGLTDWDLATIYTPFCAAILLQMRGSSFFGSASASRRGRTPRTAEYCKAWTFGICHPRRKQLAESRHSVETRRYKSVQSVLLRHPVLLCEQYIPLPLETRCFPPRICLSWNSLLIPNGWPCSVP